MENIEKTIGEAGDTFMEDCLKRFPNPGNFCSEGEKVQADHKKEILWMAKGILGENLGYKIAIEQLQNDFKNILGDLRSAMKGVAKAKEYNVQDDQIAVADELKLVEEQFERAIKRLAPMDNYDG